MLEILFSVGAIIFLLWCVVGAFYCAYVLGEPKCEHFKSKKIIIFMLCCGPIAICVFFITAILDITLFPLLVAWHNKIKLWIKS